ncbi:MAG TPA: hypothetical protein VK646_04570 [Actinomycetota bacterium]|nr:hypothetical protein [Actinomycetota bacterium]
MAEPPPTGEVELHEPGPDEVVDVTDGDDEVEDLWFPRLTRFGQTVRPWVRGVIAFVLFAIAAILTWALPILGSFGTRYVGNGYSDAKFYQWAVGWMHWSVLHGSDPLYTTKVYAVPGTSLAWAAFSPIGGLAVLPLRSLYGTLVATNVLLLLSAALAGWAAYLLCNRVSHAFWPSLVGGYLFAYSAYLTGQLHGHVNLALIFPVPLAVYLVVRYVEGSFGRVAFVLWLTVVLVVLFLSSTELFATTALFGGIAFVIAVIAAGEQRRRVLASILYTGLAYVLTALVVSPYLIAAIRNQPPDIFHDLDQASVDLWGFVIPRGQLLVSPAFARDLSARFLAHPIEDGGYLSIALVVMLVCFAVTERRRTGTWGLLAFVAVVSLIALGPTLHVLGTASVPLPWRLATNLPLLKNALPDRFPAYSALAVSVIAAIWLARSPARTAALRWGLVLVGAVMLYPSMSKVDHQPQVVPEFFTSGAFRDVLRPDEVVFAIPVTKGDELLWQDDADFAFRMPQGYLGPVPPAYAGERLSHGLALNPLDLRFDSTDDLVGYLNAHDVTAVVLAQQGMDVFGPLLRSAGGEPVYTGGGVVVWRAPSGTWVAQRPAT